MELFALVFLLIVVMVPPPISGRPIITRRRIGWLRRIVICGRRRGRVVIDGRRRRVIGWTTEAENNPRSLPIVVSPRGLASYSRAHKTGSNNVPNDRRPAPSCVGVKKMNK